MDINLYQTKLALSEILGVLIVLDCTLRNVKTESSLKLTRPAMIWCYFLVGAILWFNGKYMKKLNNLTKDNFLFHMKHLILHSKPGKNQNHCLHQHY